MRLLGDLSNGFKLPLADHVKRTIQERAFLEERIACRVQDGPISHAGCRSDAEAVDYACDTMHRDCQFQAELFCGDMLDFAFQRENPPR